MIVDAGHEIGLHGYSHENPVAMTLEQQTAVMDKCYKLITEFQGKPPRGIVAPWWEASQEGAELMLRYGLEYDHSLSHHDCQCYWLRTGDKWVPIDFKKHPEHWMKVWYSPRYCRLVFPINNPSQPLEGGPMTGLVEIPASWYLDDLPPMMFIKKVRRSRCIRDHRSVYSDHLYPQSSNSHGWVNPRDVEDLWMDQFKYFYREYDDFVFPVTVHPDVCGHPHGLLMLER